MDSESLITEKKLWHVNINAQLRGDIPEATINGLLFLIGANPEGQELPDNDFFSLLEAPGDLSGKAKLYVKYGSYHFEADFSTEDEVFSNELVSWLTPMIEINSHSKIRVLEDGKEDVRTVYPTYQPREIELQLNMRQFPAVIERHFIDRFLERIQRHGNFEDLMNSFLNNSFVILGRACGREFKRDSIFAVNPDTGTVCVVTINGDGKYNIFRTIYPITNTYITTYIEKVQKKDRLRFIDFQKKLDAHKGNLNMLRAELEIKIPNYMSFEGHFSKIWESYKNEAA